jgi:kynureninase
VASGLAVLVGASTDEVAAMNSLTVNLHLLLSSFYRPTATRFKILIERAAFSSDRYAVQSHLQLHGHDPATGVVEVGLGLRDDAIRTEDVIAAIEREQPALVWLPGVQYLSGQRFDMAAITRVAHRQGCVIGWDLAHAIGNVALQLHDWDADFAVWCSYKYLNAGPGAIGGAFVHARHAQRSDLPRLAGWWGHDSESRFAMPAKFQPIPGARGWQVSNPPILSMTPLIASLELFTQAGWPALQRKSVHLTRYLHDLLLAQCGERLTVITPTVARGAQLSLRLQGTNEHARGVFERLVAADVMCDWREPDIIRVAPVPLYNRFTDAWDFVQALKAAL